MGNQKKLRIAIVTNNYTPYSGGVVSSINSFSKELLSLGHEILIVTLDFLGKRHNDPSYVIRIPSIARFEHGKNRLAIPWRPDVHVERILRHFCPDIIHSQHPFLIGVSALHAARELNIPILFTYHTLYERYTHYIPFYQPIVRHIAQKKVFNYCKKVDWVIAPSKAIQTLLLNQSIKTPISLLPSPIQKHFLPDNNLSFIDKKEGRSFNLILVSRLVEEKNIPFVLDLMQHLDPKKFVLKLVGYGPQENELRQYAYQKLGLSENQVCFIIKPSQDELISLYKSADLFLFSSQTDTQGLVLAESMAAGTPVVALDGPGQQDVIKDGVNGFIIDSKEEMVKKIRQIAENAQLHQKLCEGAFNTAQNYAPEVLTKHLLDIYLNLIG